MDEAEIQKRIDELKVVQFWLEQNTRALTASIHALEVQKGTVATLKSMHAGMQQMGQSFADNMAHSAQRTASAVEQDVGAAAAPTPTPTPTPKATSTAASAQPQHNAVGAAQTPEPRPDIELVQAQAAQWWTALTEQFQTIASKAMEDIGNNVAALQQEPLATKGEAVDPSAERKAPQANAFDAAGLQKTRSAGAAIKAKSKSKPTPK